MFSATILWTLPSNVRHLAAGGGILGIAAGTHTLRHETTKLNKCGTEPLFKPFE